MSIVWPPENLQAWNDDDPLKPLAHAALAALRDLHTPVAVRDLRINAFGLVEGGRSSVPVAKAAGFPSGALGNAAPDEFAALHNLVLRLGKGDAKRGIRAVVAAMGAQAQG